MAASGFEAQARATATEARDTLARLRDVYQRSQGLVPSATELAAAEAAAERGEANIASAQANVAQARATLSSNETNLSKAAIRSPIDGVVLSRSVEPGNAVAASLQAVTLFTLAEDLTKMKLQVNVDEADVGQVRAGQAATFTVSAYPNRRYPARIERVGFGSTTKDNVVTYLSDLSVNNDDLSLRPGMTATASILTSQEEDVFTVPNAALRFQPADAGEGDMQLSLFRGRRDSNEQEVTVGRGARQTLYALDEDGSLDIHGDVVENRTDAFCLRCQRRRRDRQ